MEAGAEPDCTNDRINLRTIKRRVTFLSWFSMDLCLSGRASRLETRVKVLAKHTLMLLEATTDDDKEENEQYFDFETSKIALFEPLPHHDVAHGSTLILSVGGDDDVDVLHDALESRVELVRLQLKL